MRFAICINRWDVSKQIPRFFFKWWAHTPGIRVLDTGKYTISIHWSKT